MLRIRKSVFGVLQKEFADIAGTSQGTVSKWEAGELAPDRDQLEKIRKEAIRRELDWDDSWFFETPPLAPEPAKQAVGS